MSKKIVKKHKLKIKPFLLGLLFLLIIILLAYYFINTKTKNIIIKNTSYIEDTNIINYLNIKDYPNFYSFNTYKQEKKLKKSIYINNAFVNRKFYNVLEIIIDENMPLYYNNFDNTIVFSNSKTLNINENKYNFNIPRVINYIPDKERKTFINKLNLIDKNILEMISDIEYLPNDYDKERFAFYMDDGNLVYMTLTRFKKINYYNNIVKQLENHKGILYLDSGNHFEIKE